ncbi:hypothetical protein [Halalkalibacter flavus]|jgi:hypothetical protein|uniref:hypothetical protein n=1 Tax=Halalkalibacter flavus TaxID=3090668 RepID=UPI002FC896FD
MWVIIAIVLVLIWLFAGGDDKKQIASEIKNHWNVTNIHHIEVINDNKSVAFFKTVDGTEMEMYLEKSLFSWNKKRDYFFIPEGINEPIHLSFFDSPYSNEEEYNAILLRVFDKEIDSVQIVKGEDIIHNFKLLTKGSGERFGLFRTENDGIYDAEYIAYNSEGEII